MHFDDEEIQRQFDSSYAAAQTLPDNLRRIAALMDCYGFFQTSKGVDNARARKIVAILTSQEVRVDLRNWYQLAGMVGMNPAAREFRRTLSKLVGEDL